MGIIQPCLVCLVIQNRFVFLLLLGHELSVFLMPRKLLSSDHFALQWPISANLDFGYKMVIEQSVLMIIFNQILIRLLKKMTQIRLIEEMERISSPVKKIFRKKGWVVIFDRPNRPLPIVSHCAHFVCRYSKTQGVY